MYVKRSELPMEEAIQLGQVKGPIGIVGPISQPRGYQWSRVTHAGMYSHTIVCFPYQLYSRQLRVTCILIYIGAVSHRARSVALYFFSCIVVPTECYGLFCDQYLYSTLLYGYFLRLWVTSSLQI